MGLYSGSLTFFRLFYDEDVTFSLNEIVEHLREYSFDRFYDSSRPINYGFVPLNYPEYTDFLSAEVLFDNDYVFSVRIDEKKLNKKYFDIKFQEMKKEFLEQNKKDFLSKSDKDFIKNALTNKMFAETLPTTSLVEIIWKTDKNQIFVSNIASKSFEAVVHLFRAAFEINLYRDSLFESAKRNLTEVYKIDELKNVTPANF